MKNWQAILLLAIGLIGLSFYQGEWFHESLLQGLIFSFAVFFVFLIFYIFKFMGAGDVKMASVFAFCIGWNYFFKAWLLSIALIFVWKFFERVFRSKKGGKENVEGGRSVARRDPYAAILAVAFSFVYFLEKV